MNLHRWALLLIPGARAAIAVAIAHETAENKLRAIVPSSRWDDAMAEVRYRAAWYDEVSLGDLGPSEARLEALRTMTEDVAAGRWP